MNRTAFAHLLWIVAAAGLGFVSAFLFADVLHLSRPWFLVPHVALTLGFLLAYARWSGTRLRRLWTRRLKWGVLAALALGAFLTVNVLGQPASARPEGARLVLDVLWLGVVYGTVDALLLSVMPVVAAWRACKRLGLTASRTGRIAAAMVGIAASMLVTSSYHLGCAEFRGPKVGKAIVGNTLVSAVQIVSASPVAAAGSHAIMHVAAVLHGAETTVQLPPHRSTVE